MTEKDRKIRWRKVNTHRGIKHKPKKCEGNKDEN